MAGEYMMLIGTFHNTTSTVAVIVYQADIGFSSRTQTVFMSKWTEHYSKIFCIVHTSLVFGAGS